MQKMSPVLVSQTFGALTPHVHKPGVGFFRGQLQHFQHGPPAWPGPSGLAPLPGGPKGQGGSFLRLGDGGGCRTPARCPLTVSFFGWEGSPAKIDYRKEGCPYSNLSGAPRIPWGNGNTQNSLLQIHSESKRALSWIVSLVSLTGAPAIGAFDRFFFGSEGSPT